MSDAATLNAEQATYWNGPGGTHWVAQQAHTDTMLAGVAAAAIAHAAPQAGERALDIGCGCGSTTLLLADAVGAGGSVLGLDISAPMLGVARERAAGRANIAWALADAAAHPFEPAGFDLLFSRFGVMFFGDPVAAFANLRRGLRPGGRMVFACWRTFDENPWMKIPLQAAYAAGIPRQPRPGPEDPGPFAFADPARVTRILTEAGWAPPSLTPLDLMLDIAAGGGLEGAVDQATQIGAASRALRDAPEDLRPAGIAAIREALAPHATGANVRLGGAVWVVSSSAA